jgi:peroxiredoxin
MLSWDPGSGRKEKGRYRTSRNPAFGMKPKIFLFAASVILVGLAWIFFTNLPEKHLEVVPDGKIVTAPLFSLPTLNGEKIRLADFRGKVVILDFWATWCPPCQEGIPHLNELYREYRNKGLAVIGVSLDRVGPEEVQRFLDRKGVEYINVMGSEEVFQAYSRLPGFGKIQGIPTAFLIDREGRVHKKFVGLTGKRIFETAIKSIL